MKPGAIKLRYPGGDPENGPAYMQQWTGEVWQCLVHKPVWDEEDQEVYCKQCDVRIIRNKEVKLIANRHATKIRRR